jgi:hypothetical protein
MEWVRFLDQAKPINRKIFLFTATLGYKGLFQERTSINKLSSNFLNTPKPTLF